MPKIFEGVVVSLKMQKTAVVEVTRVVPHPMYKKLIKKDKRIKADTSSLSLAVGDRVRIGQTKPISKLKAFKVLAVLKNDST
jgi:small subunit ribosomal protein S17